MKAWRVRAVRDEREPQMQMVTRILEMLRLWGQKLRPYLMLVILLPGGILLALLLFLYRRRSTVLSPALAARMTSRRPE